jgi:hypothetical protein
MTTLYTIKDDQTKFCRKGMKAHDGSWNPVTSAWMFTNADDHAKCDVRTVPQDAAERSAT